MREAFHQGWDELSVGSMPMCAPISSACLVHTPLVGPSSALWGHSVNISHLFPRPAHQMGAQWPIHTSVTFPHTFLAPVFHVLLSSKEQSPEQVFTCDSLGPALFRDTTPSRQNLIKEYSYVVSSMRLGTLAVSPVPS